MADSNQLSFATASIFKQPARLLIWSGCLLIFTIALNSCTSHSGHDRLSVSPNAAINPLAQVVTATFDSNGRLWRVIPTKNQVFVDYSDDFGSTFSNPVAVNKTQQKIQANSEDRPSIIVDKPGVIYITYFANDAMPWTTFLSVSSDAGQSFSKPVKVSQQANRAKTTQDVLALSPSGIASVFWNDNRDHSDTGAVLYQAEISQRDPLMLTETRINDAMCECCRLAVDYAPQGSPVIFARMVLPGNMRDHGVLHKSSGQWSLFQVTNDQWQLNACPEHGPGFSIADTNRYHFVWFTQGTQRQGLFYAYSDDQGQSLSTPIVLGNPERLPGHGSVISSASQVALVWKEFDGKITSIKLQTSSDNGLTWSSARTIASDEGATDYPFLLSHDDKLYVSWFAEKEGYRLLKVSK